ncbi:hypothetical protein RIF29_09016 [Crotalaria pallida]|uniref:Epidermal patterning factor-like protein n=1 Tax=Crotalaria pallida TaxID=3830 RepID=A0AAN9IHN7_CROPI
MCYILTLIATLLLSSLVCVIFKPFSPFGAVNQQALSKPSAVVDQTTTLQHVTRPAFDSTQETERLFKVKFKGYKESFRGLSRLGSTPPRCEHKCGGCNPCDPIQIPTTKDIIGVQYANYEPEGWKCKCGNSYFNP